MAVDRLSVTVPAHLGEELRACAEREGVAVSAVVARAIEQEIRHIALGRALDEMDRMYGPPSAEQLARADELLDSAERLTRRKRSKSAKVA